MKDQNSAPIDKNDLLLLMEAYENTIKLNTTLLEQQKRLLTTDDILRDHLNKVHDFQTDLKTKINELNFIVMNSKTISDDVKLSVNSLIVKLDKVSSESSSDHTGMKIQLYFALFGMVSLVGTIVTTFVQIYHMIKPN